VSRDVQVFGLYLSTYIIVIISIDRCMAILDPISKNRGPHRVKVMIGIAWILSAVFSMPQVRTTGHLARGIVSDSKLNNRDE